MPIDPSQALGAVKEFGNVSWSRDQVILYHLGVGAGARPTDPKELLYTYEDNLKVLPSYGVIPNAAREHRLKGIPGMDFNPAMLLHGENDLEIHSPIPPEGTVTQTMKIADIWDKGKAAVVVSETESRDASGKLIFLNRSSSFMRGEGGWGGDPGPKAINEAPDRKPDLEVESPTLPQQALLYRLNGDKNPLHADPDFASRGGFDQPILHGLCTYGMVCKAVVDHMLDGDCASVARYQVRFAGVVFPGETIITSMWKEDDKILIQARVRERNTPALSNAAITLRS